MFVHSSARVMTARDGVTVDGDASTSPRMSCMNFSASSTAPVARLTLTTEFALGAKNRTRDPSGNPAGLHDNFLTNLRWSPDGACLLTVGAEDNVFRVYDVPAEAPDAARDDAMEREAIFAEREGTARREENEPKPSREERLPPDALWPALRVRANETARDYAWFPTMTANDASTCLFASACKSQPVHLWSALDGKVKASYGARNRMDEPVDFNAIEFADDGGRLFAGSRETIRTWDVTRPGYDCTTFGTTHATRGTENTREDRRSARASHLPSDHRTAGLVSALKCAPSASVSGKIVAVGWTRGAVGLFHRDTGELLLRFTEHRDCVTRVVWSPCGHYLYTAARKDARVLCWDARNASGVAYSMRREARRTNQKIGFDVEPSGRHLVTGGTDGILRAFDLRDGAEKAAWRGARDAVSDWRFHPFASWGARGDAFHATGASCSGRRRFLDDADDADDDAASLRTASRDPVCGLRVWRYDSRVLDA